MSSSDRISEGEERANPSRRQLQREGNPLQPLADGSDIGLVAVGESKAGTGGLHAVEEERDGVGLGERFERIEPLALDSERASGRDEKRELGEH